MKLKRFLCIMLITAMALFAVSCGKSGKENNSSKVDPDTAEHITLALRSGVYSDAIKSCITSFEEEKQVICDIL